MEQHKHATRMGAVSKRAKLNHPTLSGHAQAKVQMLQYDRARLGGALEGMLSHEQLGRSARLLEAREAVDGGQPAVAAIRLLRVRAWHQNIREARRDLGLERKDFLMAIDHTVAVLRAMDDARMGKNVPELSEGLEKKGYRV